MDGAGDPVQVTIAGKAKQFFRLTTDGDRLLVRAQGPVVLSVRLRAQDRSRSAGVFRIVRDDGPFSDDTWQLERDPEAAVDLAAGAPQNAVSVARVFHIPVPEGEHTYALGPVRGPPLLVRVLKAARFDPTLAPSPERAVAAVSPRPRVPRPPRPAAPARELDREADEPPDAEEAAPRRRWPPDLEFAPIRRVAPAANPFTRELLPPARLAPSTVEPDHGPVVRKGGPALALRSGLLVFTTFPAGASPTPGETFDGRATAAPVLLELAWDAPHTWSAFAELGLVHSSLTRDRRLSRDGAFVTESLRSTLLAVPLALGFTIHLPIGDAVGFRLRLGGIAALARSSSARAEPPQPLVEEPLQSGLALGATAGLAFEVKAGPGRLSLEGRWLLLRSDHGLPGALPPPPSGVQHGDLGGPQLLAGYRLEL